MSKKLFKICFELIDGELQCECGDGDLLADIAARAGIALNLACGSTGKCGRCAVQLNDGEFESMDNGVIKTAARPLAPACRTLVRSDARVFVPQSSLLSAGEKVLVEFEHLPDWKADSGVQTRQLKLPVPSQDDSIGDLDRIARQLGLESNPVADTARINEAGRSCRESGYEVAVSWSSGRGDSPARLLRVVPVSAATPMYGLAIDIGTTSVVCVLVDLSDGRIIDTAGGYNQQVRRCGDVASRISSASTSDGLADMHRLIIDDTINQMIAALCRRNGMDSEEILKISIAGNTVMTHLLLGVDPSGLGAVPFAGAVNSPAATTAGKLGLAINADAEVLIAPAVGAYVGGDITADMVACSFADNGVKSLLVDIGTNAEIVACRDGELLACAAPAGPAFEGQGTANGIRAASGAIDSVAIDASSGELTFTVIGDSRAVGICGSGYIDFIAETYRAGLINMVGRFEREAIAEMGFELTEHVDSQGRALPAWPVAPGVVVTEADIASVLQAKGVIRAGVDIILKRLGITGDDLDHIYLAGGFARHLNLENTLSIGMLPDLHSEKFRFIGNGSVAGAYLALLDRSKVAAMAAAAVRPKMVELNLDPEFQDMYAMCMMLGA